MRITIITDSHDGDLGSPIFAAQEALERLRAHWRVADSMNLMNGHTISKTIEVPDGQVDLSFEYGIVRGSV